MMILKNLSKNGEMLKNVGENIKNNFALMFFYTLDIRNIILTQSFTNIFAISIYDVDPREYNQSWESGFCIWRSHRRIHQELSQKSPSSSITQ